MTDTHLFYVYQADGYNRHHPAIIRAASEAAAKDHHKQYWRDMFDKPAGAEPHDDTYAKRIDAGEIEPGEVVDL
jgi:hypothetical protein